MEVHTCLWNDVSAFDFAREDLQPIVDACPFVTLSHHEDEASFLAACETADILLTWDFPVDWYASCRNLKYIITPAAGNDWISYDPSGQVKCIHGSFHGEILAESLLSALLFMNHRMPAMMENFQARQWDRNLQRDSMLLRNQQVMIIGMGSIGEACARLIATTGASVTGVRRQPELASPGLQVFSPDALPDLLPQADHVVLLLPGGHDTDGFMTSERLLQCKPGAYIYNFGRGNSLRSEDLVSCWDHLGGAFLDVTDEEPLPDTSPLWSLDNIMITPHSSCVYREYRGHFVREVIGHLQEAGG